MNHGKTRQINFYNIDETFYFVDLPGYGYSKMSKKEQEQVGKFIEEYLFSRENISLIVLLLDIRHKPTENDKIMYEWLLDKNIPFTIVATKADKIAKTKIPSYLLDITKTLFAKENIIAFSSENKFNLDLIEKIIKDNV